MVADGPDASLAHVHWIERPALESPVMLVAFEGWSDAGDAASSTVRYLGEQYQARPFATIDPEEFFDFSTTRPRVEFDDDRRRQIAWPDTVLSWSDAPEAPGGLITVVGSEPQLRWRTFTEQVVGVAQIIGARLVVTFGALLAEVPHTRPVSVFGTADDQELGDEMGLLPVALRGAHRHDRRAAGGLAATPA